MARCFAKDRMLTVVDTQDNGKFLTQLNTIISQLSNRFFDADNVSDLIQNISNSSVRQNLSAKWIPDFQSESFKGYQYYADTYAGDTRPYHPVLQTISQENMSQFISEGFHHENRTHAEQGSFLHAMCYFLV